MKKHFIIIALFAALLLGCKDSEEEIIDGGGTTTTTQPSIELVNQEETVVIPSKEGLGTISYQIVNPVEGGTFSCQAEQSWIHDFNYDTPETVTFQVDPNNLTEERSNLVALVYSYQEGQSKKFIQREVKVIQEKSEYNYDFECVGLEGRYYGPVGVNGTHKFYSVFTSSKSEKDKSTYMITLYTPSVEDENNPRPLAGEYILSDDEQNKPMTMSRADVFLDVKGLSPEGYPVTNWLTITGVEARMTIAYEGEKMIMEIFITDEDGNTHHATFNGPATYKTVEVKNGLSDLTDNYTLDLSGVEEGYAYFWGDTYKTGGGRWYIYMDPSDVGDGLQFEIVTEKNDFSSGIAGTYKVASSNEVINPGECAPGLEDERGLVGTMYLSYQLDPRLGIITIKDIAPAVSGELNIVENDDQTCTLTFRFMDDIGYIWDGSWTGIIYGIDETITNRSSFKRHQRPFFR